MQQPLSLFYILFIYTSYVHTQTIFYECDFDNATLINNCFTTTISISSNVGTLGNSPPIGPQSDVTACLKPTNNGEVCSLPYQVDNYLWDMYFCNKGVCPTASSNSSQCKLGRFGYVSLFNDRSFELKTPSGGIDGINQQCLRYYYFMPPAGQTTLTVFKQEKGGANETIDSVVGTPFNGWIQRKVLFTSNALGYKVFFNLQKPASGSHNIAFDEISIRQGICGDEPVTDLPTTTTLIPVETITTSIPVQSTTTPVPTETTMTSTIVQSTTTSILVETTMTSMLTDIVTTPISTETLTTTPISTEAPATTPILPASTATTPILPASTATTPILPVSTATLLPTVMTTASTQTSTTSSTTTVVVETSYSRDVTTQEPTKVSTTIPIISTVYTETSTTKTTTTSTTLPVEPPTSQSSSSTTTTIIISSSTSTLPTTPISMETTSTKTIPFTLPSTTTSTLHTTSSTTTITSTLKTTTIPIIENTIISSYEETLPHEKSHIIIMATVIPIIWIAFIIALVWVNRSTGVLGGLFHPFNNGSREAQSGSYELSNVSEA